MKNYLLMCTAAEEESQQF